MDLQPPTALTVGGSDSGGAAGIQADLKTWTALGVYGMCVITAVTAQNSVAVEAVAYMTPEMVAAQIDAVLSDYGAQALKTGFIGQAKLIETIAERLQAHQAGPLIVDPVLVNHKGQSMFPPEVSAAYLEHLLPLADLITPNWPEALLLAGWDPQTGADQESISNCVRRLHGAGAQQVLITGIAAGDKVSDWWSDGRHLHRLEQPLIPTDNRHGSGDTLSAAICASLARGLPMAPALREAQAFTADALAGAAEWRIGRGHGPLRHFPTAQGQSKS